MEMPKKITESYSQRRKIEIFDQTNNPLAVHHHICKKCGYDKAEIIEKGVTRGDEDDIILYVCGSCGYTEMQDAKVK